MSDDIDYALRRQTEAARHLLANLKETGDDDDAELVADTIEGETTLVEAIEQALAEIDECDVLATGLKAKEEAFEARRHRIGRRKERLTASIEQAMIATEQTTFKLPTATLTLAKRAPGLMVSSEADIPSRFWVEQERPAPRLDKNALRAALKAKEAVPGASLDNGSVSLSVRRK